MKPRYEQSVRKLPAFQGKGCIPEVLGDSWCRSDEFGSTHSTSMTADDNKTHNVQIYPLT